MTKIQKHYAVVACTAITTCIAALLLAYNTINTSDSTKNIQETSVAIPVTLKINKPQRLKPVQLYRVVETIEISKKDRNCLLRNIFHEARGEPIEGKIAIAQVTFNRLDDGRWGNTLCGVVFARAQFSWTLDRKKRTANPAGPMWEESRIALDKYLDGTRVVNLEFSTHFHATWLTNKPDWASKKQNLATIGQHTFYASSR